MTLVLASLLLLAAGCLYDPPRQEILDLQRLPQSPLAYLDPATARQPLMAPEVQQERAAAFLKLHFAAWHTDGPLETTRGPFWAVDWIGEHEVFAENLRPLSPERILELTRQTAAESYPSLDRRAISVHRADLRALPTRGPLFNDPRKAGEGFPFDNLQHGAVPANTPLHVTHQSTDGAWVFAESALLYGWLPVTDLAWVDDDFALAFETDRYLAPTHDGVAVADTDGIHRFRAGIGSLLPLAETTADGYRILLAVADRDQRARLAEAIIPLERGEVFPLPLTSRHLAGLAERMMGQPYGWGDSFSGRDCSGTLRDLFAPFGLWLPRNSAEQARVGKVIPLADQAPPRREERLIGEGVAFLTLVRIPGHITLYLGEHEGRAALFHTLWGVRTKNLWGREGRWIVGKTAITTLEPGVERDGFFLGISPLRDRVASMNILSPLDDPSDPHEKIVPRPIDRSSLGIDP